MKKNILQLILLALVFYTSVGSMLACNINTIHKYNLKSDTVNQDSVMTKFVEHWWHHFSEYQQVMRCNNIKYERVFNNQYLNTIYYKLFSSSEKKKKNRIKDIFNTGYAIVVTKDNIENESRHVIDNNHYVFFDFDNNKHNNYIPIADNNQKFNNRKAEYEQFVKKYQNEEQYYNLYNYYQALLSDNPTSSLVCDDEFRILVSLYVNKDKIMKKSESKLRSITIDLFTYMDMCPSCWTVWKNCLDELKQMYKTQELVVNVYSMKPYNFLNHRFITYLTTKYNNTMNFPLDCVVSLDEFDKENTCIRRYVDKKQLKHYNDTSNVELNQFIDTNNIKLLKKFYTALQKKQMNNDVLIDCMKYIDEVSVIIINNQIDKGSNKNIKTMERLKGIVDKLSESKIEFIGYDKEEYCNELQAKMNTKINSWNVSNRNIIDLGNDINRHLMIAAAKQFSQYETPIISKSNHKKENNINQFRTQFATENDKSCRKSSW